MLYALVISLIAAALLSLNLIPRRVVAQSEILFKHIAARKTVMLLLIPAASLILNVIVALRNGIPTPHIQDEFSYLLAADTFCHLRLTNPTPKFWQHFETPHELMQPSYMSKYPPAQGLALALGTALYDLPILGVWFTTAVACMFIYWMLLGCTPPAWALFGGIIAVFHPTLVHWSHVYWGGSVAVIGSAMVLGAWVRLINQPRLMTACILGMGLIILANSRPFEGLLIAIPLLLWLMLPRHLNLRVLSILMLMLLSAGCCMGYYNLKITAHPLRMPFIEYSRQYDVYPKFWFLPKHASPDYFNDSMKLIHTVFERGDYYQLRTAWGFIQISTARLWMLIGEVGGPLLLFLPLIAGIVFGRRHPWLTATTAIFVVGLWSENFFLPHYAAPIFPFLLLWIVIGWQKLGRLIGRSIAVGFILAALITAVKPLDPDSIRQGQGDLVSQTLQLQSGRHLILVTYTSDHLMHDEWVYNSADVEHQRILWAHAMGPQQDKPMIDYYKDRQVWNLTVGAQSLTLNPYAESTRLP